ncbi:tRNA methyltransferase 9b-related [Anaeramoeba flamelloides]|uniref:tRNA methyltransferase 9b-related n=1 Tax=Anaeramoeba flamelloides TaxID=1746091 RepID=A0AAV7ZT42_9EUKA|nr:tRNA methyltransferase 9b-related [Anaeramoeba flamelloides]KAJ6238076.1 tRNA methyltransferase 9b-related [Anaeramoeba flamelloides]
MNIENPENFEKKFVNEVYLDIAPHFNHSRKNPWPYVRKFVSSLEEGSILADVGCGAGQNSVINPKVFSISSDYNLEFAKIANKKMQEQSYKGSVLQENNLKLSIRTNSVDHVISIAVIHHFVTDERRLQALKELCRVIRPGGTGLVTVWAFEQKNKKFTEQDNLIPWRAQKRFLQNKNIEKKEKNEIVVYERYYHLFVKGELRKLFESIENIEILSEEFDHNNWVIIFKKLENEK